MCVGQVTGLLQKETGKGFGRGCGCEKKDRNHARKAYTQRTVMVSRARADAGELGAVRSEPEREHALTQARTKRSCARGGGYKTTTNRRENLSVAATSLQGEGICLLNDLPDEVAGASFTRALHHFLSKERGGSRKIIFVC